MSTIKQCWLFAFCLVRSLGRLAIASPDFSSEPEDVVRGLTSYKRPRFGGNFAERTKLNPFNQAHSQAHYFEPRKAGIFSADNCEDDERHLYCQQFIEKYGRTPWQVPKGEEWYWTKTKAPADSSSIFQTVLFEPIMRLTGLHVPKDPTYGRSALPFSPREKLIRENERYTCWETRAFLDEESKAVNHETRNWIWYQVWWDEEAAKRTGVEVDILWCHGMYEYGGIFAPHAQKFLQAGYRVIVPDLPSHGRSTGLHAYITNFDVMAHAIHAVLSDLIRLDKAENRAQRAVVVAGQSMGGFSTVLYGLLYHTSTIKKTPVTGQEFQPKVLGLFILCPMLAIAPESRPSFLIELLARGLVSFAGRLAISKGQTGKETHDEWLTQQFERDPQGYHGKMRSATGVAILNGLAYTDNNMSQLILPFRVVHGRWDRVTSPEASQRLYDSSKSLNKQIKLYPKTEHHMLRVGRDTEDDRQRQEVLKDMLNWIDQIREENGPALREHE